MAIPPPVLDAAAIRAVVGRNIFEAGTRYALDGRVHGLVWDPGQMALRARVQEPGRTAYDVQVDFDAAVNPPVPVAGRCTCPMTALCRHIAALLVAHGAAADGASVPPAKAPAPWKRKLEHLLHPGESTDHHGIQGRVLPSPAEATPLALQFELVESTRTGRPPASGTAPRASLTVRPVMLNDKGRWVAGQLKWETFLRSAAGYYYYGYGEQLDRFSDAQRRWMKTFGALYSSDGRVAVGTMIDLAPFPSPLLWELFAGAAEAGVGLRAAAAGAAVVLHPPVETGLDVTDDGGRLRVLPRLTLGGQEVSAAGLRMIGNPGHGAFWWEDGEQAPRSRTIHLAPTAGPVPDIVPQLLSAGKPLMIPRNGRHDFVDEYLPQLARRLRLASSDGSVELPEAESPRLVLTADHRPPAAPERRRSGQHSSDAAGSLRLSWSWRYDRGGTGSTHPLLDDGAGGRDPEAELRLLRRVSETLAGFTQAWRPAFPDPLTGTPGSNGSVLLGGVQAARFTTDALALLTPLDDVEVVTVGEAPDYTELTHTPQITVRASETEEADWFDLGVQVSLGGTEVPFDLLFRALALGDDYLVLPDGGYFSLEQPEFLHLRRLIDEARALQDRDTPGLRLSRYQADLWGELSELATTVEAAASWQGSVDGLLDLSAVPRAAVPGDLRADLRPYQREGFEWLAFLHDHGLGGVLADDMGLGKTLQALALFCHARAAALAAGTAPLPFLVVAPTSVVSNWASEAARFAPGLRTVAVTETLKRSGADAARLAGEADVVVLSYALFRIDNDAYAAQRWAGLVLDEAQFVKNPATHASRQARSFPAPFKLAITGTPLENNLMDLWSLFAITAPGLFPSARRFEEYYRRPVEKDSDAGRLAQLRRRIRPLLLRRTKELVARDLPPKQEQVLELDLAPKHRTVYQRHLQRERQKVLGLLDEMDKNRFQIFRSLTLLRRLSLDASLVDEAYAGVASSKLDALLEQLEDVVAEGHRALVFSQFTSFLSKAAQRLQEAGIGHAYLDGSTRGRAKVIKGFTEGTAPVFLISLKAGGFGLNLTQADYCFILDPWWNPASENQAVDRAHRIGQTRNVMVYRLVSKDTIEEKVMALKEKKAQLFSAVIDDDAMFGSALTAEDVRSLFEK